MNLPWKGSYSQPPDCDVRRQLKHPTETMFTIQGESDRESLCKRFVKRRKKNQWLKLY